MLSFAGNFLSRVGKAIKRTPNSKIDALAVGGFVGTGVGSVLALPGVAGSSYLLITAPPAYYCGFTCATGAVLAAASLATVPACIVTGAVIGLVIFVKDGPNTVVARVNDVEAGTQGAGNGQVDPEKGEREPLVQQQQQQLSSSPSVGYQSLQ